MSRHSARHYSASPVSAIQINRNLVLRLVQSFESYFQVAGYAPSDISQRNKPKAASIKPVLAGFDRSKPVMEHVKIEIGRLVGVIDGYGFQRLIRSCGRYVLPHFYDKRIAIRNILEYPAVFPVRVPAPGRPQF